MMILHQIFQKIDEILDKYNPEPMLEQYDPTIEASKANIRLIDLAIQAKKITENLRFMRDRMYLRYMRNRIYVLDYKKIEANTDSDSEDYLSDSKNIQSNKIQSKINNAILELENIKKKVAPLKKYWFRLMSEPLLIQIENTLEKYKPQQILETGNPIKADIQSLDNLEESDTITKVNIELQIWVSKEEAIRENLQSIDNQINSFKTNEKLFFPWDPYKYLDIMQSKINNAIVELENIREKVAPLKKYWFRLMSQLLSTQIDEILEKYNPEQILGTGNPIKGDITSLHNLGEFSPITQVHIRRKFWAGKAKSIIEHLQSMHSRINSFKTNEKLLFPWDPYQDIQLMQSYIKKAIVELENIREKVASLKNYWFIFMYQPLLIRIENILEKYKPEQILGTGNPIKADITSLQNLGEFSPITQVHIQRKFWAGKAKLIIEHLQSMHSRINSFKTNEKLLFPWDPYKYRDIMQSDIEKAIVELENIREKVASLEESTKYFESRSEQLTLQMLKLH